MLQFDTVQTFWQNHEKRILPLALFLFSLFFFWLAVTSVAGDSATDDEPAHIVAGYIKLKHGYFDFYREQPPLINSLSALPLLFEQLNLEPVWEQVKNHWGVGHLFLYGSGNDADRILLLSRLPIILLFLLLCFVVYRWIYYLTGNRLLGLLGFVLTGFCPSLMAHGRLATVDMGVTLFLALSTYVFLRFLYRPDWKHSVLVGITLAAAILSKISGLIILPYFVLVFILFCALEKKFTFKQLSVYFVQAGIMLLTVLLVVEAVFLLEMKETYIQAAYPDLAQNFLGRLLIPFQEYFKEIEAVQRWVVQPYDKPQFLLGAFSFTGWWYYYPVTFLLKTPLGVIGLLIGALILFGNLFQKRRSLSPEMKKIYVHGSSMLLFIVLFMAVSASSKIDLGIRYVLPIYPFLYVFIPVMLFYGLHHLPFLKRQGAQVLIVVLVAWTALSSLLQYPGYLSYYNELIGDKRNADKYIVDSNLDWGQDLRRLARWVQDNKIDNIRVDYFGGGNPQYYLGEKAIPWQSTYPREKGYYAISRHFYRTSTFYKNTIADYEEFLKNARYITTVGGSIFVYRID